MLMVVSALSPQIHSAKQGLNFNTEETRTMKNLTSGPCPATAAVVRTKYPHVGRETTISTLAGEGLLCSPPALDFY